MQEYDEEDFEETFVKDESDISYYEDFFEEEEN